MILVLFIFFLTFLMLNYDGRTLILNHEQEQEELRTKHIRNGLSQPTSCPVHLLCGRLGSLLQRTQHLEYVISHSWYKKIPVFGEMPILQLIFFKVLSLVPAQMRDFQLLNPYNVIFFQSLEVRRCTVLKLFFFCLYIFGHRI